MVLRILPGTEVTERRTKGSSRVVSPVIISSSMVAGGIISARRLAARNRQRKKPGARVRYQSGGLEKRRGRENRC
jgi:hypothetical protein